MRRVVVVVCALLLPQAAWAWKLIDPAPYAWSREDMPVAFWVDEDCPAPIEPFTCVDVVQGAMDPWNEAPCSWLAFEVAGVTEVNSTFDLGDPRNTIAFDDPSGNLEPGVLGATIVQRFGVGIQVNGRDLQVADNGDVALNDGIAWTSDRHIAAGLCEPHQINLTRVLTHELGHVAGLGHSCDEGEPCNDPELLGAVMYWTSPPGCDPSPGVTPDDAAGLRALYGPRLDVVCHPSVDGRVLGVVPLTVRCTVASTDHLPDLTGVRWTFGDGAVAEGLSVEHTYLEAGSFPIVADLSGADSDCEGEDWEHTIRLEPQAVACDVPEPAFTVEHVNRLTYLVRNHTPVDPFGCLGDVRWQVFAGDGVEGDLLAESQAWEPVFRVPEAGPVTVVVHVGGLAGTGAARLSFHASNALPEGYSCLSPEPGRYPLGAMILPLVLVRRRRR